MLGRVKAEAVNIQTSYCRFNLRLQQEGRLSESNFGVYIDDNHRLLYFNHPSHKSNSDNGEVSIPFSGIFNSSIVLCDSLPFVPTETEALDSMFMNIAGKCGHMN